MSVPPPAPTASSSSTSAHRIAFGRSLRRPASPAVAAPASDSASSAPIPSSHSHSHSQPSQSAALRKVRHNSLTQPLSHSSSLSSSPSSASFTSLRLPGARIPAFPISASSSANGTAAAKPKSSRPPSPATVRKGNGVSSSLLASTAASAGRSIRRSSNSGQTTQIATTALSPFSSSSASASSASLSVDRSLSRDIASIQSWLISVKQARNVEKFREVIENVKSAIFTPQQVKEKREKERLSGSMQANKEEKTSKSGPENSQTTAVQRVEQGQTKQMTQANAEDEDEEFDWIETDKVQQFIQKNEANEEEPSGAGGVVSVPAGVVFENGRWVRTGESAAEELKIEDFPDSESGETSVSQRESSRNGAVESAAKAEEEDQDDLADGEFNELDEIPDFDEPKPITQPKQQAITQSPSAQAPLDARFPDAPLDSSALNQLEEEIRSQSKPNAKAEVEYPMDIQLSDGEEDEADERSASDQAAQASIPAGPAGRILNEFVLSADERSRFTEAAKEHNRSMGDILKHRYVRGGSEVDAIDLSRPWNRAIQLQFLIEQARAWQNSRIDKVRK